MNNTIPVLFALLQAALVLRDTWDVRRLSELKHFDPKAFLLTNIIRILSYNAEDYYIRNNITLNKFQSVTYKFMEEYFDTIGDTGYVNLYDRRTDKGKFTYAMLLRVIDVLSLELSQEPSKIIIAGSRDFTDTDLMVDTLNKLVEVTWLPHESNWTIVSGIARGADMAAVTVARHNNIPVIEMPADWVTYGRSAGYVRNVQMADTADYLVAFWDGQSRGTKHMIDTMAKTKPVFVVNYNTSPNEIKIISPMESTIR